ncbi:MAG: hypothetical protein JNL32_05340 [Candidatus Kapabacteria bacterium]|nr:hypothetical protein [Candidatus Kapabacteria bacterium]
MNPIIHFRTHLRPLFMVALLSSFWLAASGCGSTYFGLRSGIDVPLQSASSRKPLSEESRGNAAQIGAAFEQYFTNKLSLLIEPSISTTYTDSYTTKDSTVFGALTANLKHEYSFVQIPVIFRFSSPIEGTPFRPYFGFGGRLVLGLSGNQTTSGSVLDSTRTPRNVGFVSDPYGAVHSLDAILCGGMDMTLSDSWVLRFDTRLQRSLDDYRVHFASISSMNPFGWDPVHSPLTHLSFSLAMMLRL